MANLVKIKKIVLYTALTEESAECYSVMKLLKDNNVPFTHLHWKDGEELNGVFNPLSTWNFFDGTNAFKKTFSKVPIVHWECVYDNDDVLTNVAEGLAEFQTSQLMNNLNKVVAPVTSTT